MLSPGDVVFVDGTELSHRRTVKCAVRTTRGMHYRFEDNPDELVAASRITGHWIEL